jgi:hypothetical protein
MGIFGIVWARGDVIVGHGSIPGLAQINPTSLENRFDAWAQSFTIAADLRYELTSVSVAMMHDARAPAAMVTLSLWDDGGPLDGILSTPGKRLATVGAEMVSDNYYAMFSAQPGVTLEAGQTYWLVVEPEPGATGLAAVEIDYPLYDANTAQIGSSAFGYRVKGNLDAPGYWTHYLGVHAMWVEGNVIGVPEPGTMTLVGGGLLMMVVLEIWRRVRGGPVAVNRPRAGL